MRRHGHPTGKELHSCLGGDGDDNIFVMDADGSNQTRITGNQNSAGNPSWSPDGQRIAFDAFKDKNFEIFVVGPDGKKPRQVD